MQLSRLLRIALIADAIATTGTGLLMFLASGFLAALLGLSATLLFYAGIVLLPYAAIVGYLGTRSTTSRGAIWAVIACYIAWSIDSIAVVAFGWITSNALGTAFVIGQAVIVFLLADLQFVGLRRVNRVGATVLGC